MPKSRRGRAIGRSLFPSFNFAFNIRDQLPDIVDTHGAERFAYRTHVALNEWPLCREQHFRAIFHRYLPSDWGGSIVALSHR
jgi:hypothetical protein